MLTKVADNVLKTAGLGRQLLGRGFGIGAKAGWMMAKPTLWIGKKIGGGALALGGKGVEMMAEGAMRNPRKAVTVGLGVVGAANRAQMSLDQLKALHNINYRYF